MATTLCPACGKRIEHSPRWSITVEEDAQPEGTRTRLIANQALVIHACVRDSDDQP